MHTSVRDGLKTFKFLHFSDLFTVHVSSEIFDLLQVVLFMGWGGKSYFGSKHETTHTLYCSFYVKVSSFFAGTVCVKHISRCHIECLKQSWRC
jgi:hypothetical protein